MMTNWKIDRSTWERHSPSGRRIHRYIVSDDCELIADVWADSDNLGHALPTDPIGNARKIAAVPAMIRALEALVERSRDLIDALDGATDAFEDEVRALSGTVTTAERILASAGGAS